MPRCGVAVTRHLPHDVVPSPRFGNRARPSAATIDRLLRPIRALAKQGRRKVSVNTPLRKSITIRTYEDWNNPLPGYFEIDGLPERISLRLALRPANGR